MNFKSWLYPGSNSIRIDFVLLILRFLFGGLMLTHGFEKLKQIMNGDLSFGDPMGLGEGMSLYLTVFAEFFCSILVMLGLFTRIATVPIVIAMIIAVGIVHGNDPLESKELGLVYLIVFYVIYLSGPGRLSLDHKFFNSNSRNQI